MKSFTENIVFTDDDDDGDDDDGDDDDYDGDDDDDDDDKDNDDGSKYTFASDWPPCSNIDHIWLPCIISSRSLTILI